jgi:MYXO-CTERM domain-containing protein
VAVGFPLEVNVPAHEYDHLWVDYDPCQDGRPRTARQRYIDAVNSSFGGTVAPLSNADIGALVGCPELPVAAVGLLGAAAWRRRRRARSAG